MLVIEFAVAQLLHYFKWMLPMNGQELDMTESVRGFLVEIWWIYID
jgi:hypothetical protein